MELILFRHGPAEERDPRRWPDDSTRPLSDDGVRETRRAARGLARLVEGVDRIISSPAARAKRTAEIVHDAWDSSPAIVWWSEAAPDSPAAPILTHLRSLRTAASRVLLVGHEPTLSQLVGYALVGEEVSLVRLTKSGAASIEFSRSAKPGAGRLNWLLARRQLIELEHS